jgi:hypothetical protein
MFIHKFNQQVNRITINLSSIFLLILKYQLNNINVVQLSTGFLNQSVFCAFKQKPISKQYINKSGGYYKTRNKRCAEVWFQQHSSTQIPVTN